MKFLIGPGGTVIYKNMTVSNIEIINRYLAGESQASLSRSLKISSYKIRKILVNNNIKIRSDAEASKIRKNKDFPENKLVNQLIDGLLLGDAWIEQRSNQSNARLGIEIKSEFNGWLEEINDVFAQSDIRSSIGKRNSRKKVIEGVETISKETRILRTSLYGNFAKKRARWYSDGFKKVPEDLILTPLVLAHWYWGDGSTSKYEVKIYTNNFSHEDCELLVSKIKKTFDIPFSISDSFKSQPQLILHKNCYRERFLELIRDFAPSCFAYKVAFDEPIRRSLLDSQKEECILLRKNGLSYNKIAQKIGASATAVRNAVKGKIND